MTGSILLALTLIGGPSAVDRPVQGWVWDYTEAGPLTVYHWDDGLEDPDRPGMMKYHNGLRGRVVPFYPTEAKAWASADAHLEFKRAELLEQVRQIDAERATIAARFKAVKP